MVAHQNRMFLILHEVNNVHSLRTTEFKLIVKISHFSCETLFISLLHLSLRIQFPESVETKSA